MKVLSANEPLPFDAEKFVEMPGTPAHHYFTDVLITVIKQGHCDIHIGLCPVALIRDLDATLEIHGFDVYARLTNPKEGEFWLKRRVAPAP